MRTNPFYDAWLFLIGQTGDHENSGVGPLLTLLFLALLAASVWIAAVDSPAVSRRRMTARSI